MNCLCLFSTSVAHVNIINKFQKLYPNTEKPVSYDEIKKEDRGISDFISFIF